MTRVWNQAEFERNYKDLIVEGHFNENKTYYPRYRSRYEYLLRRYANIAPPVPQRVLDIGGGQLALMTSALWGDDCHAADIGGTHLDYLRSKCVSTTEWNLCLEPAKFELEFDVVFFSEVIEHLPIPAHEVFRKVHQGLKPDGVMICSTPNLYRLRNIVYLILGLPIFDNFRTPDGEGLGHVIEYSAEHLQWQIQRAGFDNIVVDLVQFHHSPVNVLFRLMYWVGSPLFLVARFRDNLVATARRKQD